MDNFIPNTTTKSLTGCVYRLQSVFRLGQLHFGRRFLLKLIPIRLGLYPMWNVIVLHLSLFV